MEPITRQLPDRTVVDFGSKWDGFACKCGHSEPAITRVEPKKE